MAVYSAKDKGRIAQTQLEKLIEQHRRPPKGEPWLFVTEELMFSPAFTSLSPNAMRCLWRVMGEYLRTGRQHNGRLIVPHRALIEYGVTGRLVADAIDELIFKGLVRATRGKAADGTPHPNLYRLTFFGDCDGGAPTNDWKAIGVEDASRWQSVREEKAMARATKAGRKKKTPAQEKNSSSRKSNRPLHESEIAA